MADISSYPQAVPNGDDLILGSKADVTGVQHTKTFTVQSIADRTPALSLGYASLVQLLNQTGASAPVATENYNNTGETYTWSYVSNGVYRITATGAPFVIGKTLVFLNSGHNGSGSWWDPRWSRISDTIIEVTSNDNTITNGSFEIKIYS